MRIEITIPRMLLIPSILSAAGALAAYTALFITGAIEFLSNWETAALTAATAMAGAATGFAIGSKTSHSNTASASPLYPAATSPAPDADPTERTLQLLCYEALRARAKYPEYTQNTHHDWLRAAAEELGECSKTIHNGGMTQEEMDQLRTEAIQLAATALNWADTAGFSPTEPGQRA